MLFWFDKGRLLLILSYIYISLSEILANLLVELHLPWCFFHTKVGVVVFLLTLSNFLHWRLTYFDPFFTGFVYIRSKVETVKDIIN